jgi:hypothetical protein
MNRTGVWKRFGADFAARKARDQSHWAISQVKDGFSKKIRRFAARGARP